MARRCGLSPLAAAASKVSTANWQQPTELFVAKDLEICFLSFYCSAKYRRLKHEQCGAIEL